METPDDLPRSFHVKLTDGTERDIKSVYFEVSKTGTLEFQNANEEPVIIFAAGSWTYVEVEMRDDRG